MPTLFDTLKAQLDRPPAVQQPQQQQVQQVLAAKSGRAGAGGAPKASNLTEQQTLAQNASALSQQNLATNQLVGDVKAAEQNLATEQRVFQSGQQAQAADAAANLATQGTQAREQLAARQDTATARINADESMRTKAVTNGAANKLKELSTERQIDLDDIFSNYERSNKELEFRKDAAELEQLGFLFAMNDQAYLDEIKRIGAERGLQDEVAFREEMTKVTLGNELSSTLDQLNFKSAFNAQGREYERALAGIDVEWALKFSEAAIRDENNKAMAEGATGVVKSGLDYWAREDSKSSSSSETE